MFAPAVNKRTLIVLYCLGLYLSVTTIRVIEAKAPLMFQLFTEFEKDSNPTVARNLRANARFHFSRANHAQNMMYQAENNDDVDGYEKWLNIMREEDEKMHRDGNKYEELRDYFEAKIRMGELTIQGFENRYDKDTVSSIIDHLTFRAQH